MHRYEDKITRKSVNKKGNNNQNETVYGMAFRECDTQVTVEFSVLFFECLCSLFGANYYC